AAAASDAPAPRRTGTKVAAVVVAAALVGAAAGFGGAYLQDILSPVPSSGAAVGPETVTVNNTDEVTEATAVAAKVVPSVVTIEVSGGGSGGSGSGVVIDDEGHIVTNAH